MISHLYLHAPCLTPGPPLTPHKCPGNDPLLEEERVSESAIMFKWRSVSFVCWLHKSRLHIGVTASAHPFVLLPSSLHWSRTLNDRILAAWVESAICGYKQSSRKLYHWQPPIYQTNTHLLVKNQVHASKFKHKIKAASQTIRCPQMIIPAVKV